MMRPTASMGELRGHGKPSGLPRPAAGSPIRLGVMPQRQPRGATLGRRDDLWLGRRFGRGCSIFAAYGALQLGFLRGSFVALPPFLNMIRRVPRSRCSACCENWNLFLGALIHGIFSGS